MPIRKTIEEKFWNRINKTKSCWLWTGPTFYAGYGMLWDDSKPQKKVRAHRYSYKLHFGPIPDKLFVLHHCDVSLCVNPDHLFLGTAQDNSNDMKLKLRSATGDRNGSRTHPERVVRGSRHRFNIHPETNPVHLNPEIVTGENNGRAKLTWEQVRTIRLLHSVENIGCANLARQFNVSWSTIKAIINGDHWKE